MKTCLYLLLFALAMSGCTTFRGDFTALSTKNVNLSNFQLDRSTSKGRTSGEDCQYIISFIPTSGLPQLDQAIDNALENKRANILLDAVVEYSDFYLPLIYGERCWSVKGDAHDSYE